MATRRVKVLKFGGTSMASSESIRQVISILKKHQRGMKTAAVIVSAMGGVTDQLIKIARLAAAKDESYEALLAALKRRHIETVRTLVRRKNRKQAVANIRPLLGYLEGVIKGTRLVREISPGALDYVMSFGERLSAHILTEALLDRSIRCEYLNARTLIMTDDNFGSAAVDFEVTNRNIRKHFKTHKSLQVVTGFIASTKDKKTTTLGRGGSDYTASILGAALGAKVIEIWTDVSGVMTADPRKEFLPSMIARCFRSKETLSRVFAEPQGVFSRRLRKAASMSFSSHRHLRSTLFLLRSRRKMQSTHASLLRRNSGSSAKAASSMTFPYDAIFR